MDDRSNRIRVTPRFRKDAKPTFRQVLLTFLFIFVVCFLAWAAQQLGYWPESWKSNGDIA
ncbi:MAG: hypothetical protein ABJN26_21755 [Stappiaceae bacterium]